MRLVKCSFIALMIALPVSSVFGEVLSVPKKNFSVTVHGRYGTHWVKVYKDGSNWICNTEAAPYFVAHGNPLKEFQWKNYPISPDPGNCRDLVTIEDRLQAENKTTQGCLDQLRLKKLVDLLDRRCRAE